MLGQVLAGELLKCGLEGVRELEKHRECVCA